MRRNGLCSPRTYSIIGRHTVYADQLLLSSVLSIATEMYKEKKISVEKAMANSPGGVCEAGLSSEGRWWYLKQFVLWIGIHQKGKSYTLENWAGSQHGEVT